VSHSPTNEPPSPIELDPMWIDPDNQVASGMLLSDRIKFYVEQVKLIDPFDDEKLGPASYALTIGPDYWYAEDAKIHESSKPPLKPGDKLRIPPNSIVFVSTAETLNVPFYLAARFNLKLKLIYEGLIVGAGPQVDPGFRGRLSCPLHNISDQAVYVNGGETFAIIDFVKTTPFAEREQWAGQIAYSEVRRRGENRLLKGKNDLPCLTFPVIKLDRQPIKGYVPFGKVVSSSVAGVEERVKNNEIQIQEGLKKLDDAVNRVNWIALISIIVVTISLGTYFYAAVNWGRSMRDDALKITDQKWDQLREKQVLESRINELEEKVRQLQTSNQNDKQSNGKNPK
jgi:deoxycytidine triphosphate deaminase